VKFSGEQRLELQDSSSHPIQRRAMPSLRDFYALRELDTGESAILSHLPATDARRVPFGEPRALLGSRITISRSVSLRGPANVSAICHRFILTSESGSMQPKTPPPQQPLQMLLSMRSFC
jgi:hypothetical protein